MNRFERKFFVWCIYFWEWIAWDFDNLNCILRLSCQVPYPLAMTAWTSCDYSSVTFGPDTRNVASGPGLCHPSRPSPPSPGKTAPHRGYLWHLGKSSRWKKKTWRHSCGFDNVRAYTNRHWSGSRVLVYVIQPRIYQFQVRHHNCNFLGYYYAHKLDHHPLLQLSSGWQSYETWIMKEYLLVFRF